MMHYAWKDIEEMPYCFWRSFVKFQGHRRQKIANVDLSWTFPDCNSNLNSLMPWKWYIKLEEAKERSPIVFQCHLSNYIDPGSQIPQVEARKRCSRDLFTSSGRATALINRHFWYAFLQQSMTRLTNTAILLTYTSRFHWRFSGNWQEHICERKIRCFGSPDHLSLGSDQLNVTICRTCSALCRFGMCSGQSEAEVTGKTSLDGWRYVHQVPHISIPSSYLV